MRRIWIPQAVAMAMLLFAFNHGNPYGYYILLRWICCGVFAYLAVQAYLSRRAGWVWVLGATAVLYNPVLRVRMDRDTWEVVNALTIVLAAVSIFVLRRPASEAPAK